MSAAHKPGRRAVAAGAAALMLSTVLPGLAPAQARDDLPPPEGGIGGTGIVGLLTSVQPLSINGLELTEASDTLFRDAFGQISPASLRPGQSVTILARAVGDAAPRAVLVDRMTPLIGTLERTGTGLAVNGVALRTEQGVQPGAAIGSRVAVSGLWDGNSVVASRIDPAPEGAPDVIAGTLERSLTGNRIAGVPVTRGSGALRIPDHGFGTFLGQYGDGRFTVSQVSAGRFQGQGARSLRALLVEGYLEPADRSPGYRVSGLGHSFDRAARLAPVAGERVLFEGPYRDTFRVETGLVLPEEAGARRRLLARDGGGRRVGLR
ncbi:MAG: hypothetical protein AAGC86_13125 [Pseudomonadota bacterium]